MEEVEGGCEVSDMVTTSTPGREGVTSSSRDRLEGCWCSTLSGVEEQGEEVGEVGREEEEEERVSPWSPSSR